VVAPVQETAQKSRVRVRANKRSKETVFFIAVDPFDKKCGKTAAYTVIVS
jgi:hypothetical protein